MCRRVECAQCEKPTFAGCGRHVEQVLGDVPRAERCRCREAQGRGAQPAQKHEKPSFLDRLFNR